MRLIEIMLNEILEKNLLGEVTHVVINSNAKRELIKDYKDEFENELKDERREPNMFDLEDYFGMKILIDDKISGREKYRLLTKAQ